MTRKEAQDFFRELHGYLAKFWGEWAVGSEYKARFDKAVEAIMNDDPVKTYKCSYPVRWGQYDVYDDHARGYRKSVPVLQQAWECVETGEIEWRDVPMKGD